ncbi:MAG: hypothetical protein NWE93_03015 [Candidatus Bathyarchaeota archaeon]|nr:hypothetical protein [Candidatus Bathyarchaeota archaeon]
MKPTTRPIRYLRKNAAISTPIGNLIILLATVVLSTTVVLFAINVTSNQVQKESLFIADVTLTTEQAQITIENTGPTSIRVSQVTIKGEKFSNYTSSPEIGAGLAKGNSTTLTVTLPAELITINDVGRPITIVITTTQNTYFTETLVQASLADTIQDNPTPTPAP